MKPKKVGANQRALAKLLRTFEEEASIRRTVAEERAALAAFLARRGVLAVSAKTVGDEAEQPSVAGVFSCPLCGAATTAAQQHGRPPEPSAPAPAPSETSGFAVCRGVAVHLVGGHLMPYTGGPCILCALAPSVTDEAAAQAKGGD